MGKKTKYTPEERARKGGYFRAKKLSKRQLSIAGRHAATIRWARERGVLEATPAPFVKAIDSP